jgi:RNA polymerase sigma-70 factor (ECF subfamily)
MLFAALLPAQIVAKLFEVPAFSRKMSLKGDIERQRSAMTLAFEKHCKTGRFRCIQQRMQNAGNPLIRTRTSLLNRLKNWQDEISWQEFYDIYSNLIRAVALKSGLTETEAKDVVQETMIAVAKQMPNFNYDRSVGSFKGWLLKTTRWRITDQVRKRGPTWNSGPAASEGAQSDQALERIPDRGHLQMEALWDREWKNNLVEAATNRAKRRVDPQQYQLFDVYVNKRWTPDKVAEKFRVPVGQVYLAKHRVTALIKKEVDRLIKATA